jgi:hypothetical protein
MGFSIHQLVKQIAYLGLQFVHFLHNIEIFLRGQRWIKKMENTEKNQLRTWIK